MFPVIKVEDLSKKFTLQTKQLQTGTLRDALANKIRNPFRRSTDSPESSQTLWALRDINFTVERGETLGIVGSNGAGKSTLLKILSRITRPTAGQVTLHGRVGSLLEVGTGFHQDLSGRENIFLNGAVLGMKRHEIKKKFDQIVAFAEVERFIDTPVKRYSSGMYMRLAFAVAAHLEPEILIVDEVLAVGDAAFQKRCLGKMTEVAAEGRTVIFVSHNAAALHRLCKTAVYLERGHLKDRGATKLVLARYLADVETSGETDKHERQNPDAVPEGEVRFIGWRLVDASTNQSNSLFSREKADFEVTLVSKVNQASVHLKLYIQDLQGTNVISVHNLLSGVGAIELHRGVYKIRWRFEVPLRSGTYKVFPEVHLAKESRILDIWEAKPPLIVLPAGEYNLPEELQSIVNVPVSFEIQPKN